MTQKNVLRKRYNELRKKKYHEIDQYFFFPLIKLIKLNFKKKDFRLALYYPSNFELNVLKFLENDFMKNKNVLLPAIERKNNMNFYLWKKNQPLFVIVSNKNTWVIATRIPIGPCDCVRCVFTISTTLFSWINNIT